MCITHQDRIYPDGLAAVFKKNVIFSDEKLTRISLYFLNASSAAFLEQTKVSTFDKIGVNSA